MDVLSFLLCTFVNTEKIICTGICLVCYIVHTAPQNRGWLSLDKRQTWVNLPHCWFRDCYWVLWPCILSSPLNFVLGEETMNTEHLLLFWIRKNWEKIETESDKLLPTLIPSAFPPFMAPSPFIALTCLLFFHPSAQSCYPLQPHTTSTQFKIHQIAVIPTGLPLHCLHSITASSSDRQ